MKEASYIPAPSPVRRRRYMYENGPDPEGRLFKMRLDLNRESREGAARSIRSAGYGRYVYARIGGAKRGTEKLYDSREAAVRAIDRHYNAQMMKHVVRRAV